MYGPNEEKHAPDYHTGSWDKYTLAELGDWVHLLAKRSEHRASKEKKLKDLYDAQNYLAMMESKLKDMVERVG